VYRANQTGTSPYDPYTRFDNNSMSGGGTVIIKDVEDNSVIVGNPARKIRENF